jgi:regulatory protein
VKARRPTSLKGRALQLLAQRDQSKVELRRKLLAHMRAAERAQRREEGAPGADGASLAADETRRTHDSDAASDAAVEIESVLAWLEAQGFLSVERFAESRVNARAERFGNLRIRQELARHEVTLDPEAAQALAASELDRAQAVRERKFSAAAPDSREAAARQARFLGARGFSPEVIRRVLRDAGRPSADSD